MIGSPLRLTAYNWHGGQGSALYSFASTGGVVHTEDHRESLRHEIETCVGLTSCAEERSDLADLNLHVRTVPIGKALEAT